MITKLEDGKVQNKKKNYTKIERGYTLKDNQLFVPRESQNLGKVHKISCFITVFLPHVFLCSFVVQQNVSANVKVLGNF